MPCGRVTALNAQTWAFARRVRGALGQTTPWRCLLCWRPAQRAEWQHFLGHAIETSGSERQWNQNVQCCARWATNEHARETVRFEARVRGKPHTHTQPTWPLWPRRSPNSTSTLCRCCTMSLKQLGMRRCSRIRTTRTFKTSITTSLTTLRLATRMYAVLPRHQPFQSPHQVVSGLRLACDLGRWTMQTCTSPVGSTGPASGSNGGRAEPRASCSRASRDAARRVCIATTSAAL